MDNPMKTPFYRLMLVTHRQSTPLEEYLDFVQSCASAGITSVQLREKNASFEALLTFGKALQGILAPLNIPLIINDNIELAKMLNAHGVHLGQSDNHPSHARLTLGDDKQIGQSIDTEAQLKTANTLPLNYVGVGAIFPTQSKPNINTLWGLANLKALVPKSKHPVVAIGGITEHNINDVLSCGVDGVAVIGAIHHAKQPKDITHRLRQHINNGVKQHVRTP